MAETVQIRIGDKVVEVPDLSTVRKGWVYRVNCGDFEGPWRRAATDATKNGVGKWIVRPTTSNAKRTNGYDG